VVHRPKAPEVFAEAIKNVSIGPPLDDEPGSSEGSK
jgi:hypothetical protein